MKLMKDLLLASFGICLCSSVLAHVSGNPTGKLIAVQKPNEQLSGPERLLGYQAVISGLGRQVKKTLAGGQIVVVNPPRGQSWQSYRKFLLDCGLFSSVEADTYVTPCATVNDSLSSNQWHLYETSVTRAWDFTFGGGKIVAIVDGGVDLSHPDLTANLVPGYNVLTQTAQIDGGVVTDVRTNGHGTRVAGVAAAVGNNGIGVTGVGPDLRIMPVRVTNDAASGVAQRSDLLAGAQWAIDHGATSINVSYTGVENADVEAMGLYARQNGAFLVWAAGNSGDNWTNFDHEHVTVVGGLDQAGNRWVSGINSSGYGRGVDLYAPCTQIYTTSKGGGYGNAPAGTSFAVPQAAAALALMKDHLNSLSADRIEYLLCRRAKDLGSIGLDLTYGWGRLNIGKAVENPARRYHLELLPMPDNDSLECNSINDSGTLGGHIGPVDGWLYDSNGNLTLTPLAIPYRIKNNGDIVFWNSGDHGLVQHANGESEVYAGDYPTNITRDANASGVVVGADYGGPQNRTALLWWSPSQHVRYMGNWFNLNAYGTELTAINDHGIVAGSYYYNAPPWDGGCAIMNIHTNEFCTVPAPYWWRRDIYKISNSGFMAGWSRGSNDFSNDSRAHRWRIAPGTPLSVGEPLSYGPGICTDVNEDGDVVGTTPEWVGTIFDGLLQNTPLQSALDAPLPLPYQAVEHVASINNHGDVAGTLRHPNGKQRVFKARAYDEIGAHLSIGNLGELPTYIGSIPPSVNVTFTQADGTPYPDATVNLGYSSSSGLVSLERPASVTGPFRIFLRCNRDVIPGYEGPKFLSRMEDRKSVV